MQAQMTPDCIDNTLSWVYEFNQAYDGYCQAEVMGFRGQ